MHSLFSRVRRVLPYAALVLLFGIGGCGQKQYPVSGIVTFDDGTPVAAGVVVFESQEGEGKIPIMARGAIQADGSYQLSTSQPGDGVPPGKYRVRLVPPEPNLDGPKRRGLAFDKRYTDFSTSGLEFEVKAGPNDCPIRVTKAEKGLR